MAEIEIHFRRVDEWSFCLWEQYAKPPTDGEVWARILDYSPLKSDGWRVRVAIEKSAYDRITAGSATKRERDRAVYDALDAAGQECLDRMFWIEAVEKIPTSQSAPPAFIEVDWILHEAATIEFYAGHDNVYAGEIDLLRRPGDVGDRVTLFVKLPAALLEALESNTSDAPLSERVYSVIMTDLAARAKPRASRSSTEFDRQLDDEIPF